MTRQEIYKLIEEKTKKAFKFQALVDKAWNDIETLQKELTKKIEE